MFKPLNISPSLEQVIQSLKTLEAVYAPLKEAQKHITDKTEFAQLSKSLEELEASMAVYQETLMGYIEDITGNTNLTVCNFDSLQTAIDDEAKAREESEALLKDKVKEQLEKTASDMGVLRAEMEKEADKNRKTLSEIKELREKIQSEAMERNKTASSLREYARENGGRGLPAAVIALILSIGALALSLSGWAWPDLAGFVQNLFGF